MDRKRATKRQSRSEFIREAIYDLCSDPSLSKEVIYPQDRVGHAKGGRPKSSITSEERAALEKRRREIDRQIKDAEIEQAAIMGRVSTPQAQDAVMGIQDKAQRLKTMERPKILKSGPQPAPLKAVKGTGSKKPKSA